MQINLRLLVITFFILTVIAFGALIFLSGSRPRRLPANVIPTTTPGPSASPWTNIKYEFDASRWVRDFTIEPLGKSVPTDLVSDPVKTYTKDNQLYRYSPDRERAAVLTPDTLEIIQLAKNVRVDVKVEPDQEQTTFVWLTAKILLLIEKEKDFRKIDRIYVVDADSGEKEFLTGSFPVVDRFNLFKQPIVYNHGQSVIFEDNQGNYWKYSMVY